MNIDQNDDVSRLKQIEAGLDLLDQGITVFDSNLKMVAWNEPFLRLLEFPQSLAYVGADFESFIRHNAERGEYGTGNIEELIKTRVDAARNFQPHNFERIRPDGRILRIRGEPLPFVDSSPYTPTSPNSVITKTLSENRIPSSKSESYIAPKLCAAAKHKCG